MAESEHFHHNMEEKMQQGIIGKKTQNVQDRLLQPHVDSETLHVVSWAPWCLSSPSLPALLPMITFFFFPCLFLSHFVSAAFLMDIQGPGISNILRFPLQLRL